jgi:hypothetical protein
MYGQSGRTFAWVCCPLQKSRLGIVLPAPKCPTLFWPRRGTSEIAETVYVPYSSHPPDGTKLIHPIVMRLRTNMSQCTTGAPLLRDRYCLRALILSLLRVLPFWLRDSALLNGHPEPALGRKRPRERQNVLQGDAQNFLSLVERAGLRLEPPFSAAQLIDAIR